ncbi:MAG: hypothetical protein ABIJ96_16955 [Elusimicrobiota bacterium]
MLSLCAAPAGAVPYQKLLGQHTLPQVDKDERFQTGYLRLGHFIRNNDRAASARPDGSGSAYNLYQLYFNDAFQGKKANFLADLLFLSDRERDSNFNLASFDYLLGLAFKGPVWNLQFDREEGIPIDRGGGSWRYWDVRASLSGASGEPKKQGLGRLPAHMRPKSSPLQLRWTATVGYFLHNKSYPARPDRTGLAQMRYCGRAEILPGTEAVSLIGEADFLTEKYRALKPVAVEVSYGLAMRSYGVEVAFLREYRDILGGPGHFPYYMMRMSYAFDTRGK